MYLLLFVLAALLGVFQAQPQRSPSSIEGVVTRLGTTEPLANANVQLNLEVSADRRDEIERQLQPVTPPIDSFHRKATTDGNGHFFFDSNPLCPNASSNLDTAACSRRDSQLQGIRPETLRNGDNTMQDSSKLRWGWIIAGAFILEIALIILFIPMLQFVDISRIAPFAGIGTFRLGIRGELVDRSKSSRTPVTARCLDWNSRDDNLRRVVSDEPRRNRIGHRDVWTGPVCSRQRSPYRRNHRRRLVLRLTLKNRGFAAMQRRDHY
jgi:hypothetical protein